MDLLEKRVEQSQVTSLHEDTIQVDFDNEAMQSRSESCFGLIERGNCDVGVELGMELGSSVVGNLGDSGIHVENSNVGDFDESDDDDFDESDDDDFFVERVRDSGLEYRDISPIGSDHRSITFELRSDDGPENEREVWGIDLSEEDVYDDNDVDDDEENDEEDDVSVNFHLCWPSLHLEDRGVTADEFDWEEVDGDGGGVADESEIRIGFAEVDGDGGSVADEREIRIGFAEVDINDESLIPEISPPMVSLEDLVTRDRAEGSENHVGWEFLLDSHNLEINFDVDNRELYIVGDHDDYIPTTEYEMLFEQFAESEISVIGLPPTSKSFLENLPVVQLKVEKDDDGVVCAVCKDEMDIGNKAVQLPCNHKYHSECIVPWLKVRNTCPVCRYELPTDDTEYEQRKSQRTPASYDLLL